MTWQYNEIVRSGNSQARVKNFYPETGLIVLYDIRGQIGVGSTIVGDESGTTLTLTQFNISLEYELGYEPDNWSSIIDSVVYDGDGNIVALDEHFTGLPSQDYQTKNIVVAG